MPGCLSRPTSDQEVQRSNPARDRIDLITVWRFIAQSFSLSFHHFHMTKIMLKGYKKKEQIIIFIIIMSRAGSGLRIGQTYPLRDVRAV